MHLVNVITKLNDNIIEIDFMHRKKLVYNINTWKVKFADSRMKTICATRQITILAMTSSIVTTKFNGEMLSKKTYITTIHCPGSSTLTGVPSVVSFDENNNCKVMIKNCAPYEITIERYNLLGLLEI